MEQSESAIPDLSREKKSRSRVLSQIAIWLAVLLLTAVGVTIWDKYNYPIPYAIPNDPFWTDTTNRPPYLDKPRKAAGTFQSELRNMRRARITQHRLNQLELSDSKWKVYSSNEMGLFEDASVHFDPKGAVLFNFGNEPEPKHSFFEFKRYERSSSNELIFSNETRSESYQIMSSEDRNGIVFLRTEHDDLIGFFRITTP